jgi:hypothetical protein
MNELRISPAMLVAAAFSLCLAVLPAQAAEDQANPPQENSQPASDAKADEKVCRKIEMAGSRVSRHKICKTRAEWDEIDGKVADNTGEKD